MDTCFSMNSDDSSSKEIWQYWHKWGRKPSCFHRYTSLFAWLSPLPCSSGDIPPMPAGHSSLHFPHSDQRCPWITISTFFKNVPCSTSQPFYTWPDQTHICTRACTTIVFIYRFSQCLLLKAYAWGQCKDLLTTSLTVSWEIIAWERRTGERWSGNLQKPIFTE